MAQDIKRAEYPEDPTRCQGIGSQGQCPNQGVELPDGTFGKFCKVHGGDSTIRAYQKDHYRNYQLTKFQSRLEKHATSPQIKNLRDEVAILRMIMEEKLNKCNDANDLVLCSGAISDLALKIEKLVGSCHKLEGSMNQLLDKQAILQLASEIISVIVDECGDDTALVDRITAKIMNAIGRIGNDEGLRDIDNQ